MLRGEPKGQASPVPTGRPSSLLSSLSEDQDPGRGRTARPTPGPTGPHWPSGALGQRGPLGPAPLRAAGRLDSGDGRSSECPVRRVLRRGHSYSRTRARPQRSHLGLRVSRTRGRVTAIRALGSPATPANLSGGRCGPLLWRNRSPCMPDRSVLLSPTHVARTVCQVGSAAGVQGPDRPQPRS
jgi:hypothetical protein